MVRAIIVYEAKYGNTEAVAKMTAEGRNIAGKQGSSLH